MKKSLLSIFAMATMLLATGCSQDEAIQGVDSSNLVEASFTIDLNEGVQSRTLGLGDKVNQLYYGIFDQSGNVVPVITNVDNESGNFDTKNIGEAVISGKTATVKMRLVKGQTYDFVFWAQVKGNQYYTIGDNLKEITVNYGSDANDENRDAFFACRQDYEVENHFTETVYLKRPFAQINVGTTKADFEAAKILLGESPVTQSKMVVKNVPTTLNLLDGKVGSPTEATFAMAPLPKEKPEEAGDYDVLEVQEKEYAHLAMNYVLSDVYGEQEVVEATLEFANAKGSINAFTVSQLPIHRNYRTNIIGNILTTNGEFEVIVDNEFDGDEIRELWDGETTVEPATTEEDGKTVYLIATAEELAWVAEQVNSGADTFKDDIVRLTADIYLNNQPWTPIGLDADRQNKFQGTFEGNGKTIYDLNIVAVSSRGLTSGTYTAAGFFGALNGTAENFTIEGAVVKHVTSGVQTTNGIAVVAGSIYNTGTIEDVTVKDAVVEGNRYVAGIAGYVYGSIKNCTVENVKLTATPDNLTGEYDNGDKVGGIAGYFFDKDVYVLSGNTVTNVTITGYRDLGGIAGFADDAKVVTGSTVTNLDIIINNTQNYKNYATEDEHDANAIVGDVNKTELPSGNNSTDFEVIYGGAENVTLPVTNADEFKAAVIAGVKEITVAGTIEINNSTSWGEENLKIVGVNDDAELKVTSSTYNEGVSTGNLAVDFKDIKITFTNTEWLKSGFVNRGKHTYDNCTFAGQVTSWGESEYNNCDFTCDFTKGYPVFVYNGKVTYNNCEFEGLDRAAKVYGGNTITAEFNNCTFKAGQANKPAVESDISAYENSLYYITINNPVITNMGDAEHYGNKYFNIEGDKGNAIVTIDDEVYAKVNKETGLSTALVKDAKVINAVLTGDIDLPITSLGQQTGGSGEYKLGGESTESINIDLNTKKLNITTTYWSNIGAKNADALFTIKNGTMTSSQATGTWNSYDVTFSNCDYAIEDVVFDKAIAFANANKSVSLKDVTINETHDYYAMWITAEGQNVEIDGLTVNSSGRGIKIDEQYVCPDDRDPMKDRTHDCEKVTLSVSNATFETQSKAAILVKSAAGADITLNNVDITKVAKDAEYTVWVDEDAAAYADLVRVVGGKMKIEGQIADGVTEKDGVYSISNANGMLWFANEVNNGEEGLESTFNGKTVKLVADIDLQGIDWEPIGQTGATEFKGIFDGQNFTISNLSVDSEAEAGANYSSALFGWLEGHGTTPSIEIKNVTINVAKIVGHHNCGALVGYMEGNVKVDNCHVKNAEISCTVANDDANGDKAGALIGNGASEPKLSNCTASDSSVSAGRDAGQVVGAAKTDNVTGCSAKNVTVTDNKTGTGNNIRNEVIGRLL